jgi:hypothetical protein
MARRYAENGWALGCRFHNLRDRGLDRRGGYTLTVMRGSQKIKFYVHQQIAEYASTFRRDLFVVLGGQICRHHQYLRYQVHRITIATSADQALRNRARITGTIIKPVGPATVKGRYRCSIPLLSAGQEFVFIAFGQAARVGSGLVVGDEVALNMHFSAVPAEKDNPNAGYKLWLEIDLIEVLPQ